MSAEIIRHPRSTEYCGCCGRECWGDWCQDCVSHVLTHGEPWDRTYFAQNNEDCPYQDAEKRTW